MGSSYFDDPHGRSQYTTAATPNVNTPGSTSRANGLASRISDVLSTSYADLDLRDALDTLDTRGFTNTQDARRGFRSDLQQDLIVSNGEIIADFGQLAAQLKRVGLVIESLNASCADMRARLSASGSEISPVLDEANDILTQKAHVESKEQLLKAVQSHFVIADDEVHTITSSSEPVDDEFFRVLAKVKAIHRDSEFLLGSKNEKLGLEILDQSSKQINIAFQKLYRWIQKDFKTLNLENPQIGSSLRRALRVLAERPALFQSCMDFFAEAREHNLSDSFHAALTGGPGADTYGKPIEFQAHDPLRYIGDMLAWAHSATASEREALEVLFIGEGDELAKGIKAGMEADPWSQREDTQAQVYDGRKALNELVSRDIAGVARLLRQRTEHVISSHDDATLAYKIANLIAFYHNTFSKLIGQEAVFLDTLTALESSAQRQFRLNMRDHVASIQTELSTAPASLSPPDFLEESFETLRALIRSYDTSFAATSGEQDSFQPILAEALDPFLKACETMSKRMTALANQVFLTNCVLQAKKTIGPYAFVAHKQRELDGYLERYSSYLTEIQTDFFVESSGMEPIMAAVALLDDSDESIAKLPTLDVLQPEALMATSQQLDEFLPSALMDAMDNIRLLQSPTLIRAITESAAEQFCTQFEAVERKLIAADELMLDGQDTSEQQLKPRLRHLFPRTSAEIRVLLS